MLSTFVDVGRLADSEHKPASSRAIGTMQKMELKKMDTKTVIDSLAIQLLKVARENMEGVDEMIERFANGLNGDSDVGDMVLGRLREVLERPEYAPATQDVCL